MDPSIKGIAAGARYAPRPIADRERRGGREFVLPDAEEEEPTDEVVLEPQPRRQRSDLVVSRERLADEAGQHIDLKG